MFQDKKNATSDGPTTIIAKKEPFRKISFLESISGFFPSDNDSKIMPHYKNQE